MTDFNADNTSRTISAAAENVDRRMSAAAEDVGVEYPYLPFMEVRLLVVHPATSDNPIVRCNIVHTSLSQAPLPEYDTISYCWGDHTKRGKILIDGHFLDVPANTVAAVRHARRTDVKRTLWIDAICINQRDVDERARQVRLMGRIFFNTKENLIFLSEDDEYAEPAIRSIRNVLEEIRVQSNDFENLWELAYDFRLRDWNYSTTKMDADIDVVALTNFMSKQWFSRLWVLQETTLAAKSTCIYGKHTVPLIDVVRVAVWLQYKSAYLPQQLVDTPGVLQGANLWGMVDEVNGVNHRCMNYGLSDFVLFKMQRHFYATDPRDRIYALNELRKPVWPRDRSDDKVLSPKEQAFRLLEENRPSEIFRFNLPEMIPDYSKTPEQIFLHATRRAISEGADSPDLLRYLHHRSDEELGRDHPSWVPEWGHESELSPGPALLSHSFVAHDMVLQPEFDMRTIAEPAMLHMQGFQVDRIRAVVSSWTPASGHDEETPGHLLAWLKDVDALAAMVFADPATVSATLIGGFNYSICPADADDAAARQVLLDFLETQEHVPPAPDDLDEALPSQSEVVQAARYFERLRKTTRHRTFFVTENGRCGIGPRLSRQGDPVVLFYGARVPFALRKREVESTDYYILGECYVHGIMQGEAVREHKALGVGDEVFRLW